MAEKKTERSGDFRDVPIPEWALEADDHRGFEMTNINPLWQVGVMMDRFGPLNTNWGYTHTPPETVEGPGGQERITRLTVWYREGDQLVIILPEMIGGMALRSKTNYSDADKGCVTNALGRALGIYLGIGWKVYAGLVKRNGSAWLDLSTGEVIGQVLKVVKSGPAPVKASAKGAEKVQGAPGAKGKAEYMSAMWARLYKVQEDPEKAKAMLHDYLGRELGLESVKQLTVEDLKKVHRWLDDLQKKNEEEKVVEAFPGAEEV